MSADAAPLARAINDFYDAAMFRPRLIAYYGGSDYTNFGYWAKGTRDARSACDALMQRLLSPLAVAPGAVLDVACGKGETTRYLRRRFPQAALAGINISQRQLARAQENVPDACFAVMDATRLAYADASFDLVVCIEAAFHFDTREAFLREAWRVLRPGGLLVLTDILVRVGAGEQHARRVAANDVADLAAYEALIRSCGFAVDRLEDATEPCWRRHFLHIADYVHRAMINGEIAPDQLQAVMAPYYQRASDIRNYLLLSARKPKDG